MMQEPECLEINCFNVTSAHIGISCVLISLLKHGAVKSENSQILYADSELKHRVASEMNVSVSTVRREIKRYCNCGVLKNETGNVYIINTDVIKAIWQRSKNETGNQAKSGF